jgi:hypothetical protein
VVVQYLAGVKSLFGILAVTLIVLASPATGQDQPLPEPALYELVPADGSYAIARVCYTDEGICALPLTIPPGRPCDCRRVDGSWVSGVCTH